MPSKRNPRSSKKNRARSKAGSAVLKDVRDILRDQAVRMTPMVKDVQQMKLAKFRTCSFAVFDDYAAIVTSNSAPVTYGGYFTLAQFAGYADLTTVFDQYRIMQIIVTFEPNVPVVALALGIYIGTALDYDDATAPSANTDLEQYDNYLSVPVGQYFQRTFNPRIAFAAYSGAFTSYSNQRAGWIDCASTNVQHYGIKWYMPTAASSTSVYNVKVQAFLQFRSQR